MSLKLINDLKFAERINNEEAMTESGKDFLKSYRGYVYNNPVSYTLVNGFVNEAQKFGYDKGIMSILESLNAFIKENNISWKLSSVCESIEYGKQTPYSYIGKTAVKQVQELLDMNESQVISYIKSGALRGIQYIPEFRAICKEVYASNNVVNETRTQTYSATSPCSYCHVNEKQELFFMVNGKTFKMFENKIEEAVCDNKEFNRINSLIANMSMNEGALTYSYSNPFNNSVVSFTITEGKVTFTRNGKEVSFDNTKDLLEHCDTITSMMNVSEKMTLMNTAKNIADVFEAYDNITELDHVKNVAVVNGDMFSIVEGKENVNVTMFRCGKCGAMSKSFETMTEALKFVESNTSVNLMGVYETRITEEAKKVNPEDAKKIEEALKATTNAKIKERYDTIAMLAEQYKNDPVKISLLNAAAKQLQMLKD